MTKLNQIKPLEEKNETVTARFYLNFYILLDFLHKKETI